MNPCWIESRGDALVEGGGSSCCRRLSLLCQCLSLHLDHVSLPRSSNPACGFPALGLLGKIRSGGGSGGLGYEEGSPVRTEGVDEHSPDRHGVAVLGVEFAAPLDLADLDLVRDAAATAWDARRFAKGCKEDRPGAGAGWLAPQAPRSRGPPPLPLARVLPPPQPLQFLLALTSGSRTVAGRR